ncbi:MAG: hypothetical protein WBQ85_19395 [Candidatus Sulfotelmatobacter sp.]
MAKLPRRLAITGIVIAIGLFTFWLCANRYNLFHLPTAEEAVNMHANYNAPPIFWALRRATVLLCPGLVLGIVTMDMGAGANLVMWSVAIIVNGAIYYCLGLALREVAGKLSG